MRETINPRDTQNQRLSLWGQSIANKHKKPLYHVSHFAPKNNRTAVVLMKSLGVTDKDVLIVGTEEIASMLDKLGWHKVLPDTAASIAQRFQGIEIKKFPRVNNKELAEVGRQIAVQQLLHRKH